MLAQHVEADLVLLDEQAGRRAARALDLPVMGLIGILAAASDEGRVDLPRRSTGSGERTSGSRQRC